MKRFTATWSQPSPRKRRVGVVLTLVAALGLLGAQPVTATSVPAWHSYVLGPTSAQVKPVDVEARGQVSHAHGLVTGRGAATLTTVAGRTPASVTLDFGKDVAGTPFFDVTRMSGAPTLVLVTGESRAGLRQPASTTAAADAPAGATQVTLASTANLEVGNRITFGAGSDAQARTITAFDAQANTVSFAPALSGSVATGAAVSTTPGAPASDEAPGLAGSGGPDTLQPQAPGRVSAG